ALVSDFLAAVAEFADAVCEDAAACALLAAFVSEVFAAFFDDAAAVSDFFATAAL
ncbi:hypothetical protein HC485_25380, partial [Escherichia coli]|nr:hypothetical protein [Escherichia coli]NPJ35678.1 hypothetical protein [Escherichia coli]NPL69721.1 hypothetical protein [Escherichia coli]